VLRSTGLWRALLHRSRSDWPVVLAAGVLLLCATVLLAAGAVYGDVVALGGLRRAVLAAPPADRVVIVGSTATPADVGSIDPVVSGAAREVLGAAGGEVGLVIRSGGFVRAGLDPEDPGGLTRLASYRGIEAHADLIAGRWPAAGHDPSEAVLSEGAAAALALGVGDDVSLVGRDDPSLSVAVTITGIWRPDRTDPYWTADVLELEGVETRGPFTTSGPIVVDQADLVGRLGLREVDLEWRAIPSVDGLRVGGLDALRTEIGSLDDRLRDARLPGRSLRVSSGLPEILATVDRATLVSRSGVLLLTIQFAVLAGYSIILVAGMLIERRRVEGALLRSRGAGTGHLTAMAFGEALLLAIPAVVIAPWLAVGVVRLLGTVGPLADAGIASTATVDVGVYAVAAVAAGAGVLALTLPSLTSGGNPAGVRARLSRQVGRTFAQRIGIDLVLVILAGIALWQLRLYGSPLTENARGVLGFDPLLVAAPAIGLLAGGIVGTRIVPRLAEIGERILVRRSGLVAPIGARQLARRPLRYTRSALLLMLAAALGTFAAADAATWTASQAEQATYQAAADMRVVAADYSDLPTWVVGPAIRSVDGVRAAVPVVRAPLDVGRAIRGGKLIAFDATAAADLINYPTTEDAQRLSGLLDQLAAARPATAEVELPATARRLSVRIDADLHNDVEQAPDTTIPADWVGITVTAVLEDGDGRLHRVDGGTGLYIGADQRLEIPLTAVVGGTTVAFPGPARLQGFDLVFRSPEPIGDNFAAAAGNVDVLAVEASSSDSGDDWSKLAWTPSVAGWRWSATSQGGDERSYAPPVGEPGRIVFGNGPDDVQPIFSGGSQSVRSSTVPANPELLRAIVGDTFLKLSGAAVGNTVAASISGQRVSFTVVGSTAEFPSLDPATSFAIVDATTLERGRLTTTGQLLTTKEWWVAVDDASADAAAAAIRADPVAAADVIGRRSLARSLAGDPVSLGIIGALALGALASLVFAAIGFVVSATVTTSERITEFAILRALGLSGRDLATWVSLENAFLLIFGLVAGSALGLVLAWLVLPFATLTSSGAAAVPTPDIVIPWLAVIPLYVAALALFGVTVLIVTRQIRRAGISTVLRSGEE
jgi:hypothetical protein